MGLSSATRRFKSLHRQRDRLPAGAVVDNAGLVYHTAGTGAQATTTEPHAIGRGAVDSKVGPVDYHSGAAVGEQQPPALPPMPSDVSSKVAMAGSATADDIMVFRLNSWRLLVKNYTDYFEALASAEKAAKKALEKAMSDFNVPMSGDHCFASFDRIGVQQLSGQLKNVHQMFSAQHSSIIQGIESDTLMQLDKLRIEIKDSLKVYTDHLGPIYKRLRKQAKEVEECKEKLVHAVESYKKKHRASDAWLAQQKVRRELVQQAEIENALFKAVQAERERLHRWEATVAERLRDIVASVVVRERDSAQASLGSINGCLGYLDQFDPAAETRAFEQHFGPVLSAPMGLSGHSALADYDYMHRDSEATTVLLEGPLEREKGMIKKFQPTYVVLTTQGYLHCYSEQRDLLETSPDVSFHLADCSVSLPEDRSVFVIAMNDRKLGRSKFSFRATSASYVDHWVNAISSVSTKPQALENHAIGGTLRNSEAARAAAEASAGAPSLLPTAAGITAGELATRNANEDALAQRQQSPSSGAAETPLEGEQFYAAREYASEAAQEPSASQGTINGHKEEKPLPAYGTPLADAGTAPATAVTSPETAPAQPPTVSFHLAPSAGI
ncbi:hypothetical protein H4218_006342 [Coemansia sp. IMI 209128]|nr:hypothetical protein GGI10_005114 [Coemansia sp. RSA 2530]KAJ2692469.1 hypothetical protein H4218_006342 [Coemansia sp. IMI 209128]